jgi:hypothetical protein
VTSHKKYACHFEHQQLQELAGATTGSEMHIVEWPDGSQCHSQRQEIGGGSTAWFARLSSAAGQLCSIGLENCCVCACNRCRAGGTSSGTVGGHNLQYLTDVTALLSTVLCMLLPLPINPVSRFPGHHTSPGSAQFVGWHHWPAHTAADVCVCACVLPYRLVAGPVSLLPGHQASPGSAEFIKGSTPPGGAAAAAAAEVPAGDATTPTAITVKVPVGSASASDAGSESSAGSKSPRGPDLSAMLPTYDQLPAGEALEL